MSPLIFSPAQFATLVVYTINANPHRDDLLDPAKPDWDMGCCPRCCAGCSVLKQLIDADNLDYILRVLAPKELDVERYEWWDYDQQCFDLSWAHAWWELYPCPIHEDGDDVRLA